MEKGGKSAVNFERLSPEERDVFLYGEVIVIKEEVRSLKRHLWWAVTAIVLPVVGAVLSYRIWPN